MGTPIKELFQTKESLAQFHEICVWLLENCKKHLQRDALTPRGLAQLVIQLIQYQENELARNKSAPPFLRFPMHIFLDMKSGGSLCTVLATMFRFKSEQRWRKFDFQKTSDKSHNTNLHKMMKEIELSLVAAKFIKINYDISSTVDTTTQSRQDSKCDSEIAPALKICNTKQLQKKVNVASEFQRSTDAQSTWYTLPGSHDTSAQAESPVHTDSEKGQGNGCFRGDNGERGCGSQPRATGKEMDESVSQSTHELILRHKKRVSWRQLELLWEFLNANRDLALAYNRSLHDKAHSQRKWVEIAKVLNAQCDGSVKDWRGWCKYWVDYKAKLKQRVSTVRLGRMRTTGGPSAEKKLIEIEMKFIEILGDFGQRLPDARVEQPSQIRLTADVSKQDALTIEPSSTSLNITIPDDLLNTPSDQLLDSPPLVPSVQYSPSDSSLKTPTPPSATPLSPTPISPTPPSPTLPSAAKIPRRRRRPKEPPMSQQAARRALVRSSQMRADATVRIADAMENSTKIIKEFLNVATRIERHLKAAFPTVAAEDSFE